MTDIKDESNSNLAAILLGTAGQLNGNAEDCLMDGGTRARQYMQKTLDEIIRRFKADPAVADDAALKPVIGVLRDLQDITNMDEIAMAVKELPKPNYVQMPKPAKPSNPFTL